MTDGHGRVIGAVDDERRASDRRAQARQIVELVPRQDCNTRHHAEGGAKGAIQYQPVDWVALSQPARWATAERAPIERDLLWGQN